MQITQASKKGRQTASRPHPFSVVILLAAVATIVVGTLSLRLGPAWYYRLSPFGPPGIVVHHSATPTYVNGQRVDAAFIDQVHANQSWGIRYGQQVYHIGYHYVILSEGTVETGRPDWMPGAHTSGYNRYLGICLVGDFSQDGRQPPHPPPAQIEALVDLIAKKLDQYDLPLSRLYRHRDLAATDCPGAGVPWEGIVKRVRDRCGG